MDIALNQGVYNNYEGKLLHLVRDLRVKNIERLLVGLFDNISESKSAGYIGQLNKNDVMF